MDLFQIFILGLVQGLTEMLPVSSSGHLVLFPKLFAWEDPGLNVDAFLHLGTLFAILIYFRKDLLSLILERQKRKLLLYTVIATLPIVIIGFSVKDYLETFEIFRSSKFISFNLIVVALLMWFFDNKLVKSETGSNQESQIRDLNELNFLTVLQIGFAQCLALCPGVSRSGICAVAGIAQNMSRKAAIRFAFLLGTPAIAGAGILATKDMLDNYINQPEIYNFSQDYLALIVGFVVSLISGLVAIDFLIKFLNRNDFTVFIIYRILLGILVYSVL